MMSNQSYTAFARPGRWVTAAVLTLLLVALAAGCNAAPGGISTAAPPTGPSPATAQGAVISAATLEQEYGLRVKLLAVTAAGGMVDLRFQVVDAAKAQALFADPAAYPALIAGDGATTLTAPEEGRQVASNFKNGGVILLLYPNIGGAVQPGAEVTIAFGPLHLAPNPAM